MTPGPIQLGQQRNWPECLELGREYMGVIQSAALEIGSASIQLHVYFDRAPDHVWNYQLTLELARGLMPNMGHGDLKRWIGARFAYVRSLEAGCMGRIISISPRKAP